MFDLKKAIYVDVCTYESLKGKGQMVISILEDILKRFILPHEYPLKICIEKFDFESKFFKYNIKSWNKIASMILNEEVRHLLINDVQNEEQIQPELAVSITFDYSYNDALFEDTIIANNIAFSISQKLFNHENSRNVQNMIRETFINIFKSLNGVIGYINVGFPHATITPNSTPFEGIQGYNFTSQSQMFNKYARGYFWGNILSEKHIELLGGFSVIKEKSPCFYIEDITLGNGKKAIYLQLTEDIRLYTDEQLKSLRDFFEPILPEVNMDYINQTDPSGEIRKSLRVFFD